MKNIIIQLEADDEAFRDPDGNLTDRDETPSNVVGLLRGLAAQVKQRGLCSRPLRDIVGNRIGQIEIADGPLCQACAAAGAIAPATGRFDKPDPETGFTHLCDRCIREHDDLAEERNLAADLMAFDAIAHPANLCSTATGQQRTDYIAAVTRWWNTRIVPKYDQVKALAEKP